MKHLNKFEDFNIKTEIKCRCGWHWKVSEGGPDIYICHKCGHNNAPKN